MVARIVARRAFSTTRAQLSSPYHYPEGPRTNLPFNTKTRFFALRYWGFLATGFFAPFGIAGELNIARLFWGRGLKGREREEKQEEM